MTLSVVASTAAIVNPVTLTEALDHCHITNHDDDGYVESLIARATEWAESEAKRRFIKAQLRLTLDKFPGDESDEVIELPRPPYHSLKSLKYYTTGGVLTTLASTSSSTALQIDAYSEPARIKPAYGTVWPATRDQLNAVEVLYYAGYSTSSTGVPDTYRHAILEHIAFMYEHRGDDSEQIKLPPHIDNLLNAKVYNRVYERD